MYGQRKIAPSILSADFWHLEKDIQLIENAGAHMVHIDVMDGHFVPVITIGPMIVAALKAKTKMPLDVHLMIEKPERHIENFIKAGADYLTIHYEASTHLHRDIHTIKDAGVKAGVSLNPHTPLHVLDDIIHELDLILIMSVNPGFGGQRFIPHSLDKLRQAKQILMDNDLAHVEIEVDGGVNLGNIAEIASAGADILVAGSAIFNADDPKATIEKMKHILDNPNHQ